MAPQLGRYDYTIGWICALPVEVAAAAEMMDEKHHNLRQDSTDTTSYLFGRIGEHNVVVACLPVGQLGTSSAAAVVASQMKSSFPSIRFGLMVGIGGGVPSEEADIRLGDVVVSQPSFQYGGVVQYDFGKTETEERFMMTGSLNVPPPVLLSALAKLQSKYLRRRVKLSEHLSALDRLPVFAYQGTDQDTLYKPTCNHVGGSTCEDCRGEKVERDPRQNTDVALHFGTIASGNQVMKDAVIRDRLSAELGGVLCFEMEAAGLMDNFPCLVIRGICDYADSHKNSMWQPYAAATAAACAKELLRMIPTEPVHTGDAESSIDLRSHFGSVLSFRDSAYGSAESVLAYGTAADEFVALLIDDSILSNVFETAVSRLGTKNFERMFTELLGTYFRELERVAKKDIEYDAVYLLRRRVAYVSSEIRDLYAEEDDKNMDKFRQQAPEKAVQLNKWLEKKYGEPVDEIDLDRLGEEEDNDADINQLEPDQQLQSLQHVREFLASGRPFLNLRESCCRVMPGLNLPTDLVRVVRVVMALEAWKTRYLHRYDVPNDQSVISLGRGLKRIRWKCMCGHQFQEDVFEHKSNAAANFVQAIDQGYPQEGKSPLHRYAMIEHLSEQIQKLFSRPSSTIELPSYNIHTLPVTPRINKACSSQSGASEGNQTVPIAAELHVGKAFICFGINQLSGGPYLYHDRTSTTSEPDAMQPSTNGESDMTDRVMFLSLQAHYYTRRPWWSRMISCIELSEVKFYEFQLYPNPRNEIEINDDWHDRLPKEKTTPAPDQVWIYSPQERDITPFLSPKALTHYVNHPDHCKSGRFWWDRVPKKTVTELTCPGAKPQPGWGLIFKERWAFRWYLILWLPFVILSLLTAIMLVHYSHSPWGAAFTVMGGVTAFISWAWNAQQVKIKQKGLL